MISVSFDDMIRQHGAAQAINLLLTIEHLAHIESQPETGNEGARFQRALDMLANPSSGSGILL
jgi:hypothetical protein